MSLNFTIKQLEAFVWLAALKNFHKTAEKLYTTQPAISSRIAALETQLAVKLFERDAGQVRLTPKGQALLPYAEQILQLSSQLYEQSEGGEKMAGLLRIGVSETIVHTRLPQFLSTLHATHPNIELEITVDVTQQLRNGLIGRALDLAFLMGPVSEFQIENVELTSFPLVWAASPRLLSPQKRKNQPTVMRLQDLGQYPLLTYARNTRPFSEIQNKFRGSGLAKWQVFPSSSLAACLQMAIDGVGVGIFPRLLVEKHIAGGELNEVNCEWVPSALHFTASFSAYPPNPLALAAVKVAQATIPIDNKNLSI